jgi:hypothetical protein
MGYKRKEEEHYMDDGGFVDYLEDEEDPCVEPIKHYNPMEEAAQRYWRASRIWRDKQESTWNFGQMIRELQEIQCYRGAVPFLAQRLLDDVVEDRRPPEPANTPLPINLGQ